MKMSREELCIIQQALGLREMVLINSDPLVIRHSENELKTTAVHTLVQETKSVRAKIISEISARDKYPDVYEEHE